MAKSRAQKEKLLSNYEEVIRRAKSIILSDFAGLKTKPLFQLRDKLFEKNLKCEVVKNRILNLALKKEKLAIPEEILDKQLLLTYSYDDEIEPAKLTFEFSRENNKLQILGGISEKSFVEAEKIKVLAQLPGRDELLARLTSVINAPRAKFIYALKYNQIMLINILRTKLN